MYNELCLGALSGFRISSSGKWVGLLVGAVVETSILVGTFVGTGLLVGSWGSGRNIKRWFCSCCLCGLGGPAGLGRL